MKLSRKNNLLLLVADMACIFVVVAVILLPGISLTMGQFFGLLALLTPLGWGAGWLLKELRKEK